MLTPADLDVVMRDPGLPGLSIVLDADALLTLLRAVAPTVAWGSLHVTSMRYKPHRYCRACYRAEAGATVGDLMVHAYRHEDLGACSENHESGPAPGDRLGFGTRVIREYAIIISAFPNDPDLPQLGQLYDNVARTPMIRDLLPDSPEMWEGEVRALRHVPGRRFTAEFRARGSSRVLLKAHRRKGHDNSRRNAGAIRSIGPLRVARVLGCSDHHRLLAFEWIVGGPLSERCQAFKIDWNAIAATGAALGAMHAQLPAGLDRWTRCDETAYHFELAREVGFLRPRLSWRVGTLARRLAAWFSSAPPVQLPVHGDFSDAQVLIQGAQAVIVDLDSAHCGDPAEDLGSLLAQWEIQALRGRLSASQLESMGDALLDGYRKAPTRSPAGRVHAYTASGLLRRARFAFGSRGADWPVIMDSAVERAEQLLSGSSMANA